MIGYFWSDPIRFLESLLFILKLYLSQNNPCQFALVNIDGPFEPSITNAVSRLLDTPFPANREEHHFGIGFGDCIPKFGSTRPKSRAFHGDRRPVLAEADTNLASVELTNKAIPQLFAVDDGRAPLIIGNEEFPLDLEWHYGFCSASREMVNQFVEKRRRFGVWATFSIIGLLGAQAQWTEHSVSPAEGA